MNINASSRHIYPTDYPPGCHWAITRGWEIVDLISPGVLSDQARALLCGAIAGALMKVASEDESALKSSFAPVVKPVMTEQEALMKLKKAAEALYSEAEWETPREVEIDKLWEKLRDRAGLNHF